MGSMKFGILEKHAQKKAPTIVRAFLWVDYQVLVAVVF